MRFIVSEITSPPHNLAAEEYYLTRASGDFVMLWRNSPAVIIGRSQNAFAEVDLDAARRDGIAVIRRLTGGGAVYHDLGNVCFTYITAAHTEELDLAPFVSPVIDALRPLGIDAVMRGRNDVAVKSGGAEYKISGGAKCVTENQAGERRMLVHGTLLYDADLGALAKVLRPPRDKLAYKGIASVRARVANIRGLMSGDTPSPDEFFGYLCRRFADVYGSPERPSPDEAAAIDALADEKYSSWEWNVGASKTYSAAVSGRYAFGGVYVSYTAEGGVLTDVRIEGDFFGNGDVADVEAALTGRRLDYGELAETLTRVGVGSYINGMTPDALAGLMLS